MLPSVVPRLDTHALSSSPDLGSALRRMPSGALSERTPLRQNSHSELEWLTPRRFGQSSSFRDSKGSLLPKNVAALRADAQMAEAAPWADSTSVLTSPRASDGSLTPRSRRKLLPSSQSALSPPLLASRSPADDLPTHSALPSSQNLSSSLRMQAATCAATDANGAVSSADSFGTLSSSRHQAQGRPRGREWDTKSSLAHAPEDNMQSSGPLSPPLPYEGGHFGGQSSSKEMIPLINGNGGGMSGQSTPSSERVPVAGRRARNSAVQSMTVPDWLSAEGSGSVFKQDSVTVSASSDNVSSSTRSIIAPSTLAIDDSPLADKNTGSSRGSSSFLSPPTSNESSTGASFGSPSSQPAFGRRAQRS